MTKSGSVCSTRTRRMGIQLGALTALSLLASAGNTALAGNQGTRFEFTNEASSEQTRTDRYSWSIQKTLKPNQVPYIIRPGESMPVEFLLTADRTDLGSTYENTPVTGQVCVNNTGTSATVGLWIEANLEQSLDGGATWTQFAGPLVVPSTEVAGGTNQCFPYTFSVNLLPPPALYRNNDTVSIDNFVGFEGTSYSVSDTGPVDVSAILVEIDKTAVIQDTFTCPVGFSCSPLSSTIPLSGSYPTTPYVVTMTNIAASCGQTLPGLNTAVLTPSTNPSLPAVSAEAQVYTGTCRFEDRVR